MERTRDNIAFAPPATDWVGAIAPALFTSYTLGGQQAISDAGYQTEFATSGSANLYGILVFEGVVGQALSKQATFQITLLISQN